MYENKYGCNCTQLKTDDLYDENKTNKLIEWSDIIYIGGGSTLELVELWNKTGFYWNGYEYVTENIEESKNFKSLKKY